MQPWRVERTIDGVTNSREFLSEDEAWNVYLLESWTITDGSIALYNDTGKLRMVTEAPDEIG